MFRLVECTCTIATMYNLYDVHCKYLSEEHDIKAINHIESNLGFTLEEITYLLRQHVRAKATLTHWQYALRIAPTHLGIIFGFW